MVQFLLEYFTEIDEVEDLFQLWPTICDYLENKLGWHSAVSGLLSFIISLILIVGPIYIGRVIWKRIKRD